MFGTKEKVVIGAAGLALGAAVYNSYKSNQQRQSKIDSLRAESQALSRDMEASEQQQEDSMNGTNRGCSIM